jgi:tetratricopeptide (TPR) repeat protein
VLAQSGPELLRRLLLTLATALIVARPLVLGEDAGLAASLTDPWGMALTLLWLLAAVGWAAWRYWLRPTPASGGRKPSEEASESAALTPSARQAMNWYGGIVQTALLIAVASVFLSAEVAAGYKFSARLIAWEWFGLFMSFFVVRQLAVTPAEQHGFFAVVLAGATALAAQGVYQELAEMPSNRRLAEDRDAFRAKWREENPGQDFGDSFLEQLRLRALENNIYGPFAHPNSYAGFLVLWVPGLLGAVVVFWREKTSQWRTIAAAVCALLGLAALWLTHSRGALLGLVVAGMVLGLFLYRRWLRAHAVVSLIGLVLVAGLGFGVWRGGLLTRGVGKSNNTVAQRLEYWRTTWQMIREHPWLGVGPGNFGEHYTRFMPAQAEEKIKDPHNFALEMWSNCGVFGLAALATALAGLFATIFRSSLRGPKDEQDSNPDAPSDEEASSPLRWEFYLGGMFGLLLGFVLRVNTAAPSTIMGEMYAAGLRSVVWFAAFALFEHFSWPRQARTLALTTGIAALLLNLCVSGGIGFPSVAGMLWIAAALALNSAELKPTAWLSRGGAAMILPLPIFLGLFLGYGIYILYPVLVSDDLMREALQNIDYFNKEMAKPISERSAGVRDYPLSFIQKGVLDRLKEAERLTPDDARIQVQLAWWTNLIWDMTQSKTAKELPIATKALRYGGRAVQLDPRGAAGYWVQYRIRTGYAKVVQTSIEELRKRKGDADLIASRTKTVREQYEIAAKILEDYLPNDPHDASLHYELSQAYFTAGDEEKGRQHALKALAVDSAVTAPARKLSDRQREQLRKQLPELSSG